MAAHDRRHRAEIGARGTLEVVAHEGEVVTPPYPDGDLWVATFRDPAGNVLGVWQTGSRSSRGS